MHFYGCRILVNILSLINQNGISYHFLSYKNSFLRKWGKSVLHKKCYWNRKIPHSTGKKAQLEKIHLAFCSTNWYDHGVLFYMRSFVGVFIQKIDLLRYISILDQTRGNIYRDVKLLNSPILIYVFILKEFMLLCTILMLHTD